MARTLIHADPGFSEALAALLEAQRDDAVSVGPAVAEIIADIRQKGFTALADYTKKFDRLEITAETVAVSSTEIEAAMGECPAAVVEALNLAATRIRRYHERQLPQDLRYTDDEGVELGWRWTAVDAAGLYAPGGRASYPSSVLMNAVPAKAAGVARLCMCVPAPDGVLNPAVLAAAKIAGVDEIYKVGGAQAIAAMAYGAGPIAPVDVIVGPGNAYVAEAKRQVFGAVGIDAVAGPSEILVVADAGNDPEWIAADLLSQAEHDPSSQSILVTDDQAFARRVEEAAARQLQKSARCEIAAAAWEKNSAIILVAALGDAPPIIDRIAPEHLELAVEEPSTLLEQVRHAGAIFLGRHTPEAIGDYVAGPDHVLPTGGGARFASGLSVLNFMKRSSIISCGREGLANIGDAAATLADCEGLPSHAHSIRVRRRKEE